MASFSYSQVAQEGISSLPQQGGDGNEISLVDKAGLEDVRMYDYFKFTNTMFSSEVHTILHNDSMTVLENMEEKLTKAYPKRSKEISDIFSSLMRSASIKLSIEMTKFMTYFGKNFRIPPNVPLYEMRKEGEERGNEKEVQEEDKLEEGTATERIVQLNIKIITTRSLNAKLRQKIAEVKDQIKRQEILKEKIKQQEKSLVELQESRGVLGQLQMNEPSKNIKTLPV